MFLKINYQILTQHEGSRYLFEEKIAGGKIPTLKKCKARTPVYWCYIWYNKLSAITHFLKTNIMQQTFITFLHCPGGENEGGGTEPKNEDVNAGDLQL